MDDIKPWREGQRKERGATAHFLIHYQLHGGKRKTWGFRMHSFPQSTMLKGLVQPGTNTG